MAKQRKSKTSKPEAKRAAVIARAIVVRSVLIAGVVYAGLAVASRASDYLMSLEYFIMDKSSLALDEKPWWVTPEIESAILELPGLPERFSLLEDGLTAKISEAYVANPWVGGVRYVRKQYPNRIRVGLDLRVPVAFVRSDRLFYLTDAENVRLPGEYGADKGPLKMLPVIVDHSEGLRSVPPVGKKWLRNGIRAGLAVAREIYREGLTKKIEVRAIDVTNYKGRVNPAESEICLYIAPQIRVDWGRSPDDDTPGELSPRYKVAALLHSLDYLESRKVFLDEVESIDVRFERPAYVQKGASELVGGYE